MLFPDTVKEIFLLLLNKAKFVTLAFCSGKNISLKPHMEPYFLCLGTNMVPNVVLSISWMTNIKIIHV